MFWMCWIHYSLAGIVKTLLTQVIDWPLSLLLFSFRNFLAYKWGMETFRISHDRVVNGRKDLLIVILKEKINVEKLPPDLRPYIRKFIQLELDS